MNRAEKRASERIHVEIPVYIGREELVTHDISRTGIYFLADHPFAEGGDVIFSLGFAFALAGIPNRIGFQGEVVRVDQQDGKFGVAAKINDLQYFH